MAFGRRFIPQRRTFSVAALRTSRRFAGPGRPAPPTVGAFGRRPAGLSSFRHSRMMARGGFFKKLFKGVKKVVKAVSKVPVLGAVAKAAVGSLPVVAQVTTAVNAFKGKTPVGVAASPVGGITPSQAVNMAVNRRTPGTPRRRSPKKAKRAKRARSSGGGTAKQKAARARFAAAARKGRIRKGARL